VGEAGRGELTFAIWSEHFPESSTDSTQLAIATLSSDAGNVPFKEVGESMKYMLLVHHDQEAFARRSEAERNSLLQESVQLANQLHASGRYLGAAPLHPSSETTCVRVRDGKQLVTDGPFMETREHIGGYFLVEVRDREEAIEIAAKIPGARIGTVEVRSVTEVDGLPEF
jgi:hypothetical protein